MKRFYFACALFVILVTSCALLTFTMKKKTEDIISGTQEVFALASQNEMSSAEVAVNKLGERWQESSLLFHIICGRDKCEMVEDALTRADVSIKRKDSSKLLFAAAELSDTVSNLYETQQASFKNLL